MTNRVPGWVTPVAWAWIVLSLLSVAWLVVKVRRDGRRAAAGDLAWVAAGLYLGPLAVVLRRRARRSAVAEGLPGGGASAVAHLVGVPLVVASGLTIAGTDLWVMILVIGVLAMLLLFAYERTASGVRRSAATAALVAVATVLAFDVGMGGWMLLLHYNELMPPATDAAFWLLMQVGVVLGLATGAPVVTRLVRQGRATAPA